MSDTRSDKPREQACQATPEELCAMTLAHYERLANLAHEWNNQVPQAIKAWYARSADGEFAELARQLDHVAFNIANGGHIGGTEAGIITKAVRALEGRAQSASGA